ncbi:MAG: hypothetical protein H6624_05855 [Bdellovibrionaceae bacterium]|nr:hypothetical protein [Bdellovibrionales bacterium]MCB9083846.1 hypothetical protein [Pseudobdellovibrionaceae bacterium]
MKQLLNIFLIACLSVAVSGCGKKDKRQSIRSGRNARGPSEIVNRGAVDQHGQPVKFNPVSGTTWGEIVGSPEDAFRDAVYYFVSATVDPAEFGYVSGQPGQDTGVRFWGRVETESSFTTGPSNQRIRGETAELRVSIWDSFAGQTDGAGNVIPEYPIHIRGAADGYVNGNQAVITFSDAYGSITLEGTIGNDYFHGVVKFDNKQYWDGVAPGATGTLGNFYVATCGFFNCN